MTHCDTIHRPQNNDLTPFSNYSWLFDHTRVGSIFSLITTRDRKLLAFRLRTRIMSTARGLCKSNIVNRMARGWQQRATEYALQISRWSWIVHDILSASMIFVCLGPQTSITCSPLAQFALSVGSLLPGLPTRYLGNGWMLQLRFHDLRPHYCIYTMSFFTLTEALSPMILRF